MKFIRYWLPVLGIIGLIFFLSSRPPEYFPETHIPLADKIVHVLIYGVLGFFFARALTSRYRLEVIWKRYRGYLVASVLLTVLYGISDEYHQSFVPGRSVEVADVIADTIGGIFGACITVLYHRLLVRIKRRRGKVHVVRESSPH
jgi:VanZ family protein